MTQPNGAKASTRSTGPLPKPKPEFEVGIGPYLPFVMPYKDAWEALRDEEVSVKQLIAMRKTDGQARALYRLITLPIRSALKTATYVPEDNVEGGEEEAEFIQQMLTLPASAGGMAVPFARVIAQMLMAIFDGFTAFELVYWVPKTGPLKGKWTLKKIAHRPSDTLTFLLNDTSEFAGFRQQCMYQNQQIDRRLPAESTIYYAANEEEKPFYGQSYFQAAFYHWDKKFKLYVIAHIAAQRAAVGTRIGKIPPNPGVSEKAEFKRALADLGVAQYMTIPDNYAVESLKESTGFAFLDFINHHNSQMSKSILASFFDKEQGGGDSAKLVDFGQQSDALFLLMLQTIMSEIEEVVNQQLIPRFIDWNFGSGKYPRFSFGSLSQDQKNAMLEVFKTLAVAGQSLTIRPEFIHELEKQMAEEFGLEIDWESIEEEEALAAELQAQQEEEMLANQQAGIDPNAAPGAMPPGQPLGGGAVAGSPQIDPAILPEGFTLTHVDAATVALTDLAHDLLDDVVGLARGVPVAGQRRVRTAAGARIYGVPIGSIITRDMENKTAGRGVEGKPFGAGHRKPHGDRKPDSKVYGGKLGAESNQGGVITEPEESAKPKRTLSHPSAPGAELLDYGDGTVAVRDAKGRVSARQRYQIDAFLKLGWKISQSSGAKKPAAKKSTKDSTAR